jgi:hypothetical protein
MLRRGAPGGIIVSTESVSNAAFKAAHAYPGRPVRIIDGQTLAALLVGGLIGVREEPGETGVELKIDEVFFARLGKLSRETPQRESRTVAYPRKSRLRPYSDRGRRSSCHPSKPWVDHPSGSMPEDAVAACATALALAILLTLLLAL